MHNPYYTLITGASEGFGKALALECATRKMNLILVALPGPELINLADFIKRNYFVDAIAIEKDLACEKNCWEIFDEIDKMKVRVNMLINNAGLGSTMLFSEGKIAFFQKQIRLNIIATTSLTHHFLNHLQANAPSYILNVGSLSSYFYMPKKQVYGATKSFIYCFSKSLRQELNHSKICVSVVCPGSMNTNISVIQLNNSTGWLARNAVLNPEQVAPIAIEGLLKQKEVIIPGFVNKLFLFMNRILPSAIKRMMICRQMNSLKPVTTAELNQSPLRLTTISPSITA